MLPAAAATTSVLHAMLPRREDGRQMLW